MAKQKTDIPSFEDTEEVNTPSFDETEAVEPVKKKEQTLESSDSQSLSGDTNLQGASTIETPDQKTERLSYAIDGALPKIVQPEVDIKPLKNIDPAMLMEHINTNIKGSINSKREAQAIYDQKQAELEQLKAQAEELSKQYEGADDAGKLEIEGQIKTIQDQLPEYDLAINQATEEINKQNKIISYQSNVLDAIEKGKKNSDDQSYIGELYGSLESGSAQLGSSLAKTPGFVFDIFSIPQNLIAQYTGLPVGTSAAQAAEQLGLPENKVAEYYDKIIEGHQEKIKEKYDKGITEYFKEGEIAKGLQLLGNQVAESAPISISLMAGNIAGATPVVSTMAGGAVFGAQKKSELDKNSDLSEVQKVSNALSTGLFEGMFEQFGITKLGGIAKGVLETEGKEIAKDVAEKAFKEVYTPIAKKYLGVAAEETVGEAATQFAQNAVDKYSGYKPEINLLDGVADAAITGLGSSFVFSAPVATKEAMNIKKELNSIPETPHIVDELLTSEGDGIDIQNKAIFDKVQEFKANPEAEEQFQERLKAEMELGQVTPEQVDQINDVVGAIQTLDEKVPETISDNNIRLAAINLLAERNNIEKSIETADKALTIPQQERIKEINAQLGALSQGATVEEALNINQNQENESKTTETGNRTAVQEPNKQTGETAGGDQSESAGGELGNQEVRTEENVQNGSEGPAEEITTLSDKELEDRWIDLESKLNSDKNGEIDVEFNRVEKELIRREKESIFKAPLDKVIGVLDKLNEKYKSESEPFIQKRDIAESKEVVEKYLNPENISDNELKKDFRDAALGNPSTWHADGLKLRESINEATRRGIGMQDLIKPIEKEFESDGYTAQEARDVVAGKLKPILATVRAEEIPNVIQESSNPAKEPTVEPVSPSVDKEREHKLAERVENSELPLEVKKGLKEKGTTYISRSVEMSKKDANEIINNYTQADALDELETFTLNPTSDIKGDVRTVLLVQLATKYTNLAVAETNPELKDKYTARAVDILYAGEKFGEQAGRTLNAHKLWQVLVGKNPETAVAGVQKELDNRNAPVMDKYSNVIKDAQSLLRQLLETDEGKNLIEEKVKEALKNQKKKNIFTRTAQERKEKIAELKERLKNAPKGTASSSIVGLSSEQIEIYTELGAEYLAAGIVNFAKWAQKMAGDGLTDEQAKALWDKGKIEEQPFAEYSQQVISENNKKRAERLKSKLGELDAMVKNPDKAIKSLEDRKKILEGRDAKPEEIKAIENEIKERKKLISLSQKLDELDDAKKKQILGESIDSIIKNGYLSDIAFKNIFAKALGLDYLTDKDAKDIKNFATTIKEAEVFGEKFLANPSKENQTAYKVALYKARQANSRLSEYFKKPKSLFGLLSTFIQGNLLTPLSQITNIYANANMMPLRLAKKSVASATDWMLSKAAKLRNSDKYERTHDVIANIKGSWPGAFIGLKEGIKQLKTGALAEDAATRDLSTSLHPVTALKRFYDGLNGKDKKAFGKHLNDLTEGTLGIPPEVMFRLLNLGDKPFRRAAQAGALREQAAIRNLEGDELTKFLEMPPEEVADLVDQLGQEATFQDSNFISDWLRSKSPKNKLVGDLIKFLTVSQAPYVRTPVNIALETFQYAIPVIPLAKSIYYAKEGKSRQALDNWGKAITGFTILYVVNLLVKNGVLSGGDDEDKKIRNAQYLYDRPNMINMSALNRLLNGGNPKSKEGDHKIDIKKLGIVGSIMSAAKHVQESKEGQEINNSVVENMALMVPSTLKSSFDQSFLAGTNTLLNAMQGADDNALRKWLISTANTFGAAILPGTIGTISKADDDFFRDTRDIEIGDNIINVYKNKLFQGNELPALVNMWGEPIKNIPKDRSSWIYYLLDVTKGEKVDRNQFGIQIYDLYKQTDNPDVLPSPISRTMRINGESKKLTPKEYELLCKFIGESRKAEVSSLLETEEWRAGDEESRIEELKKSYNTGRKNGVMLFKKSTGIEDGLE